MEVLCARVALGIEAVERVGGLVARQGEDRLVDHHHRELGAGDRPSEDVSHVDVDPGVAARLDLRGARLDPDLEGAGDRRDRQVELPLSVGGSARQLVVRLAVVIDPRGGADQVDLDVEVGDVRLGDRHLEGGGRSLHLERAGLGDAGAAQAQESMRREEWGLDQDLRRLARLVLLAVGHDHDFLLLDVAHGRHVAAGDPDHDLALVGPALLVADGGGDAVGAALRGLEGALRGLLLRLDRAGLRVDLLFFPFALLPRPVEADRLHVDLGADGGLAVVIDRDGLDLDRDALIDEVAVLLEADVERRGMDEQRRRRRPGLAIDVLDMRLGDETHRARRVDAEEIDVEDVLAGGVGLALELIPLGLVGLVVAIGPPGLEGAEDELVPAGRGEAGRLGADLPVDVGVGQPAAGVVGRLHGHVGAFAHHVRPFAGGRRHLVLRRPEFLDLEGVAVLAGLLALGGEEDAGVSEVRRLGEDEAGVEAAERVDVRLALGDLVPARTGDHVAHLVDLSGDAVDVAAFAVVDVADPALERDLLARLVHVAVVVDEPGELMASLGLAPAAVVAPVVLALRQEGDVVAAPSDQELAGALLDALGQSDGGGALVSRPPLAGRRGDGQLDVRERLAVRQVGRPGDEV